MVDLNEIARKWQHKWEEAKLFEADVNPKKKKFFAHFTYPYVNAYPHIGHFYTLMQADIMARYKRLKGFNVLMPQGWHATGSPIITAAKRVKDREPKQMKTMETMGITSEEELKKFEEPEHWINFFGPEFRKDFSAIGISIDWRRNYITTSLNPHYDKFIKWQFRKLKEKNYVIKGKFPVVWCPKENLPVGDHDRVEGEGETPQEFILMKYKLDKKYIVTATLRPETVFGDTNLWVAPDVTYVSAKIGNEDWIVSKECAEKLKFQERNVEIESEIKGRDLIGKHCRAPVTNNDLIILPSSICDPNIGTGIVRSVPSHAPFDWAALNDLQNDRNECSKYKLNFDEIKKIRPISLIKVPELGEHPAFDMVKKFNASSQKDSELLDKATKELYKKEFFNGIMKDNAGKYKNLQVAKAKEEIKNDMLKEGTAEIMHELTGKVVCRCLTPSTIKIVSDQWFIAYGNKEWKKLAHKALDKLKLYPDIPRQQIAYTIDWLRDWACTREKGLGTKLPWDEKWLIESLSDSTIYFAFYPIAHLIQKINPRLIEDEVFDYIFLKKGKKPQIENIDKMREEFEYWYPFDFNTSGKDLIQNHIAFSLFNHAAIFPQEKWPAGLRINGWVTINEQKMSKSLGNVILLREIAKQFSPDAARLAIAFGGEGLDDPNWDSEFAKSMKEKLAQFYDYCIENYNKGTEKYGYPEKLMESQLNTIIKIATECMEHATFRSAIQTCYFELQRKLRQYLKLTKNTPNKELLNKIIESQVLMLAPFTPFICEELWSNMGKNGFISVAHWPKYDESKIDKEAESISAFIDSTRTDIMEVLKLAKIGKPGKIRLFVAEKWKYEFVEKLKVLMQKTRNTNELMKELMSSDMKQHGNEITKLIPKFIGDKTKIPEFVLEQEIEIQALRDASENYEEEFKCKIKVITAEESIEEKSKQAMPGKVAILVE